MLTSKERAELRAQANSIETTLIVGKEGVTETVIAEGKFTAGKILILIIKIVGIRIPSVLEDYELLSAAVEAAKEQGATYHVGNVNSSDVFYGDHTGVPEGLDSVYGLKKMGVMALEMEAAALYMNAARYGKRGLCICTISDHVLKGAVTTPEERQCAFTQMMEAALEVAVAMENK